MNKTIRFKVFQRDGFICQYCGQKPPKIVLEVDHIIPKSKKGKDDIDNLIASCFDCNRGKGNKELTDVPEGFKSKLEEIKERKKQLKEFYKYQEEIEIHNNAKMAEIACYWQDLWDGQYELSIRGEASVKRFFNDFGKEEIKEAMSIAQSKLSNDPERALRYFYGIMYTKLRNRKLTNY